MLLRKENTVWIQGNIMFGSNILTARCKEIYAFSVVTQPHNSSFLKLLSRRKPRFFCSSTKFMGRDGTTCGNQRQNVVVLSLSHCPRLGHGFWWTGGTRGPLSGGGGRRESYTGTRTWPTSRLRNTFNSNPVKPNTRSEPSQVMLTHWQEIGPIMMLTTRVIELFCVSRLWGYPIPMRAVVKDKLVASF